MPLQPQIIPIKFTGLDTSKDPKSGTAGRLSLLENAYATRDNDGGLEFKKWPGTASLSRSILGGGSIAAGSRIVSLGNQLVMTDGTFLYRWVGSPVSNWVKMGRVPEIAAVRSDVTSAIGANPFTTDVTYLSAGVTVHVASDATGTPRTTYYVQDSTGSVIATGSITNAVKPKVVTNGTDAFLFYHDGTNTIFGRKITGAAPSTLGAATALVANANATCHFDVAWDPTNSRFQLAYRNTTPATTVIVVTTGLATGASFTVANDADKSLGFLAWDCSNGSGYLAIATSATGVRRVDFNAVTMASTANTVIDGTATASERVTGYFNGSGFVFYEVPGSTTGATTRVDGGSGGATFTVQRSVGLASRVFKVGSVYYFVGLYNSDTQGHLVLIEFDSGYTGGGGARTLAGHLLAGDAGGRAIPDASHASCLGHAVVGASATQLIFTYPRQLGQRQAPGVVDFNSPYSLVRFDLTWSASGLGAPVLYGGVLHFPGAQPKVYDGEICAELGTVVAPEPPLSIVQTTGGSLTTVGTYQLCVVTEWWDNAQQRWSSNVGPVVSVTLTGVNNKITGNVATNRLTDRSGENLAASNLATVIDVRLSLYAAVGAGTAFHKVSALQNSVTADSVAFTLSGPDSSILAGEELYTDDEVENAYPPMVIAYATHRDRLFAASGDGALYFSKETRGGTGSGFSDEDGMFLDFDPVEGPFTGLASDGTTLFIAKRSRVYLLTGDGPALDGNNGYGYPQPLPSEVGFLSPRGFCGTPDGVLFKSSKGFHLLDRGGGIAPVPMVAAYDGLTVTGGVVTDDRMLAYFTTAEGRTLAWDWRLKQWYATSSGRQPAVACARWLNQVVFLKSDGTVVQEVVGTWADDGVAYTYKVQLAWLDLAQIMGFQRIWEVQVLGDFLATTTLIARLAYDFNPSVVQSPQQAVAAATLPPLYFKPARQEGVGMQITLEETSTTAGVALSALLLNVGLEPRGTRPLATTAAMT